MRPTWLLCAMALVIATEASAQAATDAKTPKVKKDKKEVPDSVKKDKKEVPDSVPTPELFKSESPLAVTLTTNMRQLRGDRSQESPWRSATLTYAGSDGKPVVVPIRAKTHGIWRLKHCEYPPLRFNIGGKESKGTVFHHVEKPKVVSPCRDNGQNEQYVLQELQLYRVYQLLTPASHKARLLRMSYVDSASGKPEMARYAFLFEDPDELAARLGGVMVKTKGATADDLDTDRAALAFVFQYFIANTDFSFNGLHNGEMVDKKDGSQVIPIAYDFDFSGAVNTAYATVDPRLPVKRVRDRLFRGFCAHMSSFPGAFARFQEKKGAIYALYSDEVGKLMDPGIVRETLEYYDEFYDKIKSPRDAERYVTSNCMGAR